MLDDMSALAEAMSDVHWRISNLYKIVDKHGQVVTFKPNEAQLDLINTCKKRDIILKARQLGFSTLACIISLDECLFNDNWRAGIIAHKNDDANTIFETKIKFPYDNLPPEIKEACPAVNDRAGALKFSNGSSISVSTSFRSGTLQRLHISEFGKICARSPDKAREIITGAFPAAENGAITIESTAEGQEGAFFEYCQRAMGLKEHGPKDYKFHFYPWWGNIEYALVDPLMLLSQSNEDYFAKLEHVEGIKLTHEQKCWYQAEQIVQGGDMKREHPSTPREAFEQALEGAYFERQLVHAHDVGSIGRFPYDPRYEVNSFWDLGRNDLNALWLHQRIGDRNRFIGYYENSGEHISHYINWLKEWKRQNNAQFDEHYLPHDGNRQDLFLENGRLGAMDDLGFRPEIVSRVGNKLEAIEAVRSIFPQCDFDEKGCEVGLKRLKHYRKEWDDKRGTWKDKPRHDDNSNGADAFMTFATGYEPPNYEDDYDDRHDTATDGRSNDAGY